MKTNMKAPLPGRMESFELSGNPHLDSFDLLGSQIKSIGTHTLPISPPIFLPSFLSLPLRKSSQKFQKLCSKDNSLGR